MKNRTSTLLTCLSSVGVIFTAISAAKATTKAVKLIDQATLKKLDDLTPVEIVKTTWKCYVPTAALATGTIMCIVGSNTFSKKQQATMASAYALIEQKYKDYIRKNKEIYGQEAHERIMRELAIEKAENISIVAPGFVSNGSIGFEDGEEKPYIFYDSWGERYFESTFSKVLEAEYHLNRNYTMGWIPSVNDFYDFLGLTHTKTGDSFGWNPDGSIFWIDFNHVKTEIQGRTCYIIETVFPPTNDYLE